MKTIFLSFRSFIKYSVKDAMLFILLFVPLLLGVLICYGVPLLNNFIFTQFGLSNLLTPYYPLFDLFLFLMTPFFFTFVCSMVVLEELDSKVALSLSISPVTKSGYFLSRLLLPALFSFPITIVLGLFFTLSNFAPVTVLFISLLAVCTSMSIVLAITAFSKNKVEGLALTKLFSVLLLGTLVPFFVEGNIQYLFFAFPSFWYGKAALSPALVPAFMFTLTSFLWVFVLAKKCINRLK